MNRFIRFLPPALVALFLGALYFRTLAPGLTWAFDGADGGDLVTAAATGGIPHPTGYPAYLAVASAFLKIPFGSLAFRTNLLSAMSAILAALVIYKIVLSLDGNIFSASIASLSFGTFPLVWSQAIITEVNAVNALGCALIIYCLVACKSSPRMGGLIGGLVSGLGMGIHMTSVFLLPLIFVNPQSRSLENGIGKTQAHSLSYRKLLLQRVIGFFLGLNIYWLIPLRARAQSPVNWGEAVDLRGFLWLVTGQMYRGRLERFDGDYLWRGLQAWGHVMLEQLGAVGLILIFLALSLLFKRSRLYLATAWVFLAYSAFAILYYSPDSYVYLLPALMSVSVWMGLASGWVAEKIPWKTITRLSAVTKQVRHCEEGVLPDEAIPSSSRGLLRSARNDGSTVEKIFKMLVMAGLAGYFVIQAIYLLPRMDLSTDRAAEQYAQAILASAPPDAIIISTGDEATFSLWYFHYAYGQRRDIAVVNSGLMSLPWYHRVLKSAYPDLLVPDMPWAEGIILANNRRPICRAGPGLQPQIECSE